MSKTEQQHELLMQLKVENQQLLEFKKLNSLMLKTLKAFTNHSEQSTPFYCLFELIYQELKPDLQLLITCNHNSDGFSIVSSTDEMLIGQDFQLDNALDTKPEQSIFSEPALFFDLNLTSKWPNSLRKLLPIAESALIQPVKIASRCYAIILIINHVNGFSTKAKSVMLNYSSFIASTLTLIEYQHVAAERDTLFSQQKRIEQSMARQGKLAAIGQLAAGVAHELNNPLGFIYSNLNTFELYLKDIASFITQVYNDYPELTNHHKKNNIDFILKDSTELIDESLQGARRAREIIKNLRSFSHPDESSISEINIIDLINDTVKIATTEVKKSANIIVTHYLKNAFIQGNTTQLNQVLLNLINNAHHSITRRKGLIEINTSKRENWINIEISDNGCGINENDTPHIFEPFFTTKEVGKGTGLGLSISKAILEQYNGYIALDYTGQNGTKFVISLPEYNNVSDN
ncbi:sensor histidine kinase [Shewanella septentrionalis]|uniref:histidine kinase n=1 Tax=Shewanella septentrionalis TaxID=2952223 RepID=A0A9X3AS21_9GAMM|nr:ATP-binding protein [Shewanella septentrionalis]MCT7943981.1 ATP-binding protein [Shewanella septentrionalis]